MNEKQPINETEQNCEENYRTYKIGLAVGIAIGFLMGIAFYRFLQILI